MSIAWGRLALFTVAATASTIIGYSFAGYVIKCDKAAEILISIFSILTSVILAVMTLSTDFRQSVSQTASIIDFEDRLSALARLILLFGSYVIVLVSSFILVLLDKDKPLWLAGVVLGFATFAMIMSAKMPFDIYKTLHNKNPANSQNQS